MGIIYFKQWFRVFDPHPCCPSSHTSLKPPSSSRAVEERRGLGTGRKYAEWRDALLKYCLSNLFSRSTRPGDEERVIERVRKEGHLKYFPKGEKNPTRCINCRRRKGQRAANTDKQATLQKGNRVLEASSSHCSRPAGNRVS